MWPSGTLNDSVRLLVLLLDDEVVVSDDLRSEYCDESATLDSLRINFFIISSVFSLNFSASEKIDIKKQTMERVRRALYEERERESNKRIAGGGEGSWSEWRRLYLYLY